MPDDDDLESLLRKLETELGQVQQQLASARARGPQRGEPPRRSTLRMGAVTEPEADETPSPPTVREVPRHTGVQMRVPATLPLLPATTPEPPPETKSKPDGRYTIVAESPRRRKG